MRCMIHDMVKCRDCAHRISPSARNCPQCGGLTEAAIRADKDIEAQMFIFIIILIVVSVILLFLSNHSPF